VADWFEGTKLLTMVLDFPLISPTDLVELDTLRTPKDGVREMAHVWNIPFPSQVQASPTRSPLTP